MHAHTHARAHTHTHAHTHRLDEESIRPGEASDASWMEKMTSSFGSHDHYTGSKGAADKTVVRGTFVLKHYAGDVTYNSQGAS